MSFRKTESQSLSCQGEEALQTLHLILGCSPNIDNLEHLGTQLSGFLVTSASSVSDVSTI